MSPTIVTKDGKPVMTVGSPSSNRIITTNTQIMMNYLDLGMTLPQAILEPRLSQRNLLSAKAQYEEVFVDKYGSHLDELKDMGHTFTPGKAVQGISAATGVEFLPDGKMRAAAEATRRGGGSAMAIDMEDIKQPGDASIDEMKTLIDQYEAEREITNSDTVQWLQTHLTAIGHYKNEGVMEKAIKHMKSFKKLILLQVSKGTVTEYASTKLLQDADNLIEKWQ